VSISAYVIIAAIKDFWENVIAVHRQRRMTSKGERNRKNLS